jgi:SAM-dependent methyltransferase
MERELVARYADRYRRHWWWRARETILVGEIERLPLCAEPDILDVGCGDGLFFPRLELFGDVRGIEVDESLLSDDNPARSRIHSRPLGDPAYRGWRFDLITALDVIEHLQDDAAAVAQMASMLVPGGWLVVTVPAFTVLWDRHDELNQHYRRYTRERLCALLAPHGAIRSSRYLFPGLFVPKLAAKGLGRVLGTGVAQDAVPPAPLNRLLSAYFRLEDRIVRPLRLPFGTSVLAVIQAPVGAESR